MYESTNQKVQNEILILYVLGKLDVAVSDSTLTDLILKPGLVNYFGFREALDSLVKNGSVSDIHDNDGQTLLQITDSGKVSMAATAPELSPVLKAKYDEVLRKDSARIVQEMTVNAYVFVDANKNLSVRCYIRERGNKIVDLRLPVPDRETGEAVCENWKKNAYALIPKILLAAMD